MCCTLCYAVYNSMCCRFSVYAMYNYMCCKLSVYHCTSMCVVHFLFIQCTRIFIVFFFMQTCTALGWPKHEPKHVAAIRFPVVNVLNVLVFIGTFPCFTTETRGRAVAFLCLGLEVVGWSLCRSGTGYAKSLCRGFQRSLQANVWVAPLLRHDRFSPHSFPFVGHHHIFRLCIIELLEDIKSSIYTYLTLKTLN